MTDPTEAREALREALLDIDWWQRALGSRNGSDRGMAQFVVDTIRGSSERTDDVSIQESERSAGRVGARGGPALPDDGRELDRWWTDGAMVNGGESGDEHFVGDAATADDAERIATAHNATVPSHVHVPGSEWEDPVLVARREGYDQGFLAALPDDGREGLDAQTEALLEALYARNIHSAGDLERYERLSPADKP